VGIQVTILGSGSAGNCALIETDRTAVLVDAGLSHRQITLRLAGIQRSLADIDAILLTHEHSDHTNALTVIGKHTTIPVYANRLTAEEVKIDNGVRIAWRLFTTGSAFEIGDLSIESFSIPHDASDPVGFTLRDAAHTIAFATDFGHATKLVLERIRGADMIVLESNHDLKLLQDDTIRPWATKQRIMSRHGHLSNDDAATVIGEVASAKLRHVVLAHLSRDCNRPELAQHAVEHKLKHVGATHVKTAVAQQHQPMPTVIL
jgi:phosphoribosyl 1,2-cyclic phosphodiesterase